MSNPALALGTSIQHAAAARLVPVMAFMSCGSTGSSSRNWTKMSLSISAFKYTTRWATMCIGTMSMSFGAFARPRCFLAAKANPHALERPGGPAHIRVIPVVELLGDELACTILPLSPHCTTMGCCTVVSTTLQ